MLQAVGHGIVNHEGVLGLDGRRIPVVRRPSVTVNSRCFPRVGQEQAESVVISAVGPVGRVGAESVGLVGEESSDAGKMKVPGV